MPLVELLQNLQNFNYYYGGPGNFTQKSIPYGKDLPGGGSSGGPLVQFPLPENADSETLAYYATNRSSLDYPMRGASLNFTPGGIVVAEANKYDVQRISRFYKRAPRGYTFIAKQVGLQLTNPKLEVGNQANINPGSTPARYFGVIENTRIYNGGLNTLTQVRLQGSGVHADRHGTVPYNPLSQTYEKVVASFNSVDRGKDNRLVTLLNTKIYNLPQDRNNLQRLGISKNVDTLFQYPGGPGSVYGIGLTTVPRYYNNNALYKQNPVTPLYEQTNVFGITPGVDADGLPTNTLDLKTQDSLVDLTSILSGVSQTPGTSTGLPTGYLRVGDRDFNNGDKNRLVILQTQLISGVNKNAKSPIYGAKKGVEGGSNVNSEFIYKYEVGDRIVTLWRAANTVQQTDTTVDAGKNYLPNNNARTLNSGQLYTRKLFETRVNAPITDFRNGLDTKKFPTKTNYTINNMNSRLGVSDPGMIADRNDVTKSISTDKVSILDVGEDYGSKNGVSDLIKFKFEAVEYSSQPQTPTPIIFRAYLTGLQDNHTGEITPFRYTGRGENFYTYNGFTRTLSFNFKVAVQSREEMKPLYRKLNYLISQLYPDYSTVGFMRSPLIRMTIGDYIFQQPGFLTSVNVTVGDDTPWEINLEEANDIYQLPHVVDVACQFTPIHNFLPSRSRFSKGGDKDTTYITPLITPVDSKGKNNFNIGY